MPYATITESHRRKEAKVDLKRFATDLCAEMGGKDLNVVEHDDKATFMLGQNQLSLFAARYTPKPEITVRISAPDVSEDDKRWNGGRTTASATINPDARSLKAIAADIQRRVIDASADALTWMRTKSAEYAVIRQGLADLTPALTQLGFEVRDETKSNGLALRALGPGTTGLSVRVTPEAFEIERVGKLSLDQLRRIVAIVNEKA